MSTNDTTDGKKRVVTRLTSDDIADSVGSNIAWAIEESLYGYTAEHEDGEITVYEEVDHE